MPLAHFVVIDGIDVSPWVMGCDIDVVIPQSNENFVQQCDLTLSNVGDRFTGAFGSVGFGVLSKLLVVLYSIEYNAQTGVNNPNVYTTLAFTGECQNVDAGYQTVKIHAGTVDANANDYIAQDIHKHNGQPTGPALEEVLAMYNLPIGAVHIPNGMEKREWEFMRDQSGKGVLDYLADWDGQETFISESGKFYHVPPGVAGRNPDYTGRMKAPAQSESAIAFCDKVLVRGGSFINAKEPGSELLPADAVGYETTLKDLEDILQNENGEGGKEAAADMIASYGWIRAPTFFFPDCTTEAECRKRAIRLLARYITYWKRTMPAVVGRSPKLRSLIEYRFPRLIDNAWQLSTWFSGRVVRCKTNYSPKAGWVSYNEIQPFVINAANSEKIYGDSELGL